MLEEVLHDDREFDNEDAKPNPLVPAPSSEEPKSIRLALPSTFGDKAKSVYVEQELLLRQGQAEDALHAIRISLSEKAGVFRNQVRHANSQQTKTRAWSGITVLEKNVAQQAHIYFCTQHALVLLNANEEVLQRFQVLKKDNLSATTSVMDPSIQHHQNQALSWIWRMKRQGDYDDDKWMHECKSFCQCIMHSH